MDANQLSMSERTLSVLFLCCVLFCMQTDGSQAGQLARCTGSGSKQLFQ